MKHKTVIWGSLWISLAVASPAGASTFKVGTGAGCTHSTIQAAVNAANANPGLDQIIITRSMTYTAQAVKIQQAQPLTLTGGYATCADSAQSGGPTIVSGSGGAADSVFTVESGAADILFDDLFIRDGDESIGYHGGGIDFTGSGMLTLNNISLTQNEAGYGGGLSARGIGPDANVLLSGDTSIVNNLATQDGGGVHLRGTVDLYALEPRTAIALNRATGLANTAPSASHGYGGGMAVVSPATAFIGSIGNGLGVFFGNTARAGGGIAALSATSSSSLGRVYLFTVDPTKPQKITGNRATDAGGAFYADALIGDGQSSGNIWVWDTTIENNSAPVGSIAYVATNYRLGVPPTGLISLNPAAGYIGRPTISFACNPAIACSVAKNNRSEDAMGNPSNGALINGTEDADIRIENYRFTGNSARSLFDLASASYVKIANSLIDNNTFTSAVLEFPQDDPEVELNHLTVTDNSVGGPGLIAHHGHVALNRSVIWQPGKTVRATAASSGTFDGDYVLANETASIPGVANPLYPFDPGFINPTLKDYHLRAGSECLDAAPSDIALDGTVDLDRLPRSVNLPLVPPSSAVDLGAFERQSITNIMVNDSFNSDLSQWTLPVPSIVSRDSDNGNGPSGSGSLKVDGARSGGASSLTVARQCQVLPGPSDYRVTGWGRSFGTCMITACDGLRVHWKVFKPTAPAYGCTGLVLDEGDVIIPATNNWLVSPVAAQFGINYSDYVSNAAVEISLVAVDVNGPDPQGYRHFEVAFDGITLEVSDDRIFDDGFDFNQSR